MYIYIYVGVFVCRENTDKNFTFYFPSVRALKFSFYSLVFRQEVSLFSSSYFSHAPKSSGYLPIVPFTKFPSAIFSKYNCYILTIHISCKSTNKESHIHNKGISKKSYTYVERMIVSII